MNLPAPPYARFQEKLKQYEAVPAKAVADFEDALRAFFEVEAVTTFTNCFTALSMALLYATRKGPKNVAIAGLAYRRTTDIVLWAGLRPVYIDNDPENLGMSLSCLEAELKTGKLGCVLVQHPMVNICNPDDYIELGSRYGVPVVLDSVEATGATYRDKKIGGFGVVEGFSLHPSKVINAAEGGVLTFGRRAEYQDFLTYLRELGIVEASSNKKRFFGLEPLHAMMGLASLDVYQEMRAMFKSHYCKYRERLQGSDIFRVVEYDLSADPNFKSVLVELPATESNFRGDLIKHLESHNIGIRAYYAPLHPMTKGEALPEAKRLAERYIFLPIGHSVSIPDIEFICDTLAAYTPPNLGSGDGFGFQGNI